MLGSAVVVEGVVRVQDGVRECSGFIHCDDRVVFVSDLLVSALKKVSFERYGSTLALKQYPRPATFLARICVRQGGFS